MSNHRIDIVEIGEVLPHPDPEVLRMEITNVFGWTCCIGKGQFRKGDKAVYIEPDYVVKTDIPEFAFLAINKFGREKSEVRITVRRFRGVMSQGLLIKVPETLSHLPVGSNVIEELKIVRYEATLPKSTYGNFTFGPSGIHAPKFDVENYQRYREVITAGEEVVITEKIHGCLHANTKVMLVNGEERPIYQIEVGDVVLSYDENKKTMIGSTVKQVVNRSKSGKWIKLQFRERQIICTVDHRFMTNRGWVEAENLTFDDEILSFAP